MRISPIHKSLCRPNLVLGCDRELIIFSGLLTGALVFSAMDLIALFAGILIWSFSLFALRRMAKADPQMRHVYLRHRKYKRYYPPRSMPFCTESRVYQ
ncbi:conjugal transfer protein TrbD [Bilophila wadsworthia]|uniref:conjugal transfer protein TrbD n=1 Tax=Bilophila wadsworthia TaxID=35833 RepID=UPI00241C707F|nr:conjugal transfer protein TrbD [Bilophila wadsworthia]